MDGTSDSFHFAAQPMVGDASANARVTGHSSGSGTDKEGVMIRAGLDSGAPYFHLFYLSSQNSLAVEAREAQGATAKMLGYSAGGLGTYLKVERQGNLFTAYSSSDGLSWKALDSDTIAMPEQAYGGVAVSSLNSNALTIATFDHASVGCFVGGFCGDIGNVGQVGDQSFDGTSWTVSGAGDVNGHALDDTGDDFHYVAQPIAGDASASARVTGHIGGSDTDKAGVMFRASLDLHAAYFHLFYLSSEGRLAIEVRDAWGATAKMLGYYTGGLGAYLRVTRQGNLFTAYSSSDGTSWKALGSDTIAMPPQAYDGMAVASLGTGRLTTATFDHVALGCFADGSCSDIGGPSPTGGQSFDGTSWSLWGAGNGLDSANDSFHFAAQPIVGDASAIARVTGQIGGSSTDKAGVMIRANLDPTAPYFHLFYLSSQGSLAVEERRAQGATASLVAYPAGALGTYLKVERQGNLFTAYSSADGATWTVVASDTIAMPERAYGGLAVSSLNSNTLTAATFDHVSVGCFAGGFCGDIGGPSPTGGQSFDGAGWTLWGAGNGLDGTSDSFHFAAQPMAGDGGVAARVTGQIAGSGTDKAGVMIRAGLDSGAPYFHLFYLSSQNSLAVEAREAQGATAKMLGYSAGGLGTYLKVERQGDLFTAYSSADGIAWVALVSDTIAMPTRAYGGLAVSSLNSNALTVARFSGISVANGSFEAPSLGAGNWAYSPSGASWDFPSDVGHGASGITANGSGFTANNPAAPDGDQVALVQGGGSISQTITGWQAGLTYTLAFAATQRGQVNSSPQGVKVMLDGTTLGTFTPSGTGYQDFSVSFSTSAGAHTLAFVGATDGATSDDTAFIDDVRLTQAGIVAVPVAPSVVNSSFEAPALGTSNWAYSPSGASWDFPLDIGHGASGIAANGSAFTANNPAAPDGNQAAFVQGGGAVSQKIAGWQAGLTYTLAFAAAQRGQVNSSPQGVKVMLDGTVLGTFTPSGTGYQDFSVSFSTSAGAHTLAFVGATDGATSDDTALIDNVRLTQVGTGAA